MIRNAVANVDNLCWNLMRHAAGGDISSRNILLIEALLDIYQEHRYILCSYVSIEGMFFLKKMPELK
jgi:integrator complex subunit 3